MYTNFGDTAHNTKANYGVGGNNYVSVLEFGKKINAGSILVYGESEDPHSVHFFDQAPLYAEGQFKKAYFDKKDVEAHAERTYDPG